MENIKACFQKTKNNFHIDKAEIMVYNIYVKIK